MQKLIPRVLLPFAGVAFFGFRSSQALGSAPRTGSLLRTHTAVEAVHAGAHRDAGTSFTNSSGAVGAVHSGASRGTDNGAGSSVVFVNGSHAGLHSGVSAGRAVAATVGGGGVSLETALDKMVMKLIRGQGPTIKSVQAAVHAKMDLQDALNRLEGRLPADMDALVGMVSTKKVTRTNASKATANKTKGEFDEESLGKARTILNTMIENSWKELDAIMIECKEFEDRNRGSFSQVTTDLARLGSQIADLSRKRVEANDGIAVSDQRRKTVDAEISKQTLDFQSTRLTNQAELTRRQNDLAVFNFILAMVRCEDVGSAFMQEGNASSKVFSLCGADSADIEIKFTDLKAQAKYEKMMTPTAREALREILGQVATKQGLLLQNAGHAEAVSGDRLLRGGQAPPPNSNVSMPPRMVVEPDPVIKEPDQSAGQWKKCTDGKPNCGLLHDTMSLQWGKFKDSVDELQHEMTKNADAYRLSMDNMKAQEETVTELKGKYMEMLAETISQTNADTQEMSAQHEQYLDLEKEYTKKMAHCKSRVEEVLFTNICAVKKVRNSIMTHSETSPPESIDDCEVTEFAAAECSVDCDDNCPQPDPYMCGGTQELTREVVSAPNSYGIRCPVLTTQRKCNQFKCPVDCVLSEWSGFSKCTKDCEGGVQMRTRAVITRAKNGGSDCDSSSEMRGCNTGSCDRDCTLAPWSRWSYCTMACGGGIQERIRNVVIPIRAQGECPAKGHPDRLQRRPCNEHDCVGDEICIATQDLVLAIDGSGSLKEDGFEIMRSFAVNLTGRYAPEYYGKADMLVGAVVFGNGHVLDDGTVAPAKMVQGLTADMEVLREKIAATEWQKGMTNMAQAFILAEKMFQQSGRVDSQSAVLVLSDGKYSFEFSTAQKVRELKDTGVQIFMAAVDANQDKQLETLKTWASEPYETNYERIPGLPALKNNLDRFAQVLVSKFCPNSMSPSSMRQQEDTMAYMLLREMGSPDEECGRGWQNLGAVQTADQCAEYARTAGLPAFTFRAGRMATCRGVRIEVTPESYQEWQRDRHDPPCPGGRFNSDPFADVYVLEPLAEEAAATR